LVFSLLKESFSDINALKPPPSITNAKGAHPIVQKIYHKQYVNKNLEQVKIIHICFNSLKLNDNDKLFLALKLRSGLTVTDPSYATLLENVTSNYVASLQARENKFNCKFLGIKKGTGHF
jgi:hypothetical protein